MFIHKIFHLHQPLQESRQQVTGFGAFRELMNHGSRFDDDGTGHFEVKTRLGQRITADIRQVPSEDPNRIVFHSIGGNVDLAGMIEFVPIRENLTEVVLTLDYEVASSLGRAFDMLTSTLDRFLNQQLTRLELCLQPASRKQERSASGFLAHA